ncbi:unnamed protein product, partial [Ectocarpus sp. 8 AP-2014]
AAGRSSALPPTARRDSASRFPPPPPTAAAGAELSPARAEPAPTPAPPSARGLRRRASSPLLNSADAPPEPPSPLATVGHGDPDVVAAGRGCRGGGIGGAGNGGDEAQPRALTPGAAVAAAA